MVPSAVASPIFAGCVAAVFFASGGSRFNPDHGAMIFVPGNEPELPLSREKRRAYRQALKHLPAHATLERPPGNGHESWECVQSKAESGLDRYGRPVLQTKYWTTSGICRGLGEKRFDHRRPSAIHRDTAHREAKIRIAEE
jgi:hypothetical protein